MKTSGAFVVTAWVHAGKSGTISSGTLAPGDIVFIAHREFPNSECAPLILIRNTGTGPAVVNCWWSIFKSVRHLDDMRSLPDKEN